MELATEDSWTQRWGQAPGVTVPSTTVGESRTTARRCPPNFFVHNVTQETSFQSKTVGVYAQDFLELTPMWKLLAGVRYDYFDSDYERIGPLTDYGRTDRVWSFRTGLLFQPVGRAVVLRVVRQLVQSLGRALRARPARREHAAGEELQLRARRQVGPRRTATCRCRRSLYRSEKTNERNTDPLITDVFLLSGRRHTDGIELEAAGRITPAWEVFGGVAFMRAQHRRVDQSERRRQDADQHAALHGEPVDDVPVPAVPARGTRLGGGRQALHVAREHDAAAGVRQVGRDDRVRAPELRGAAQPLQPVRRDVLHGALHRATRCPASRAPRSSRSSSSSSDGDAMLVHVRDVLDRRRRRALPRAPRRRPVGRRPHHRRHRSRRR